MTMRSAPLENQTTAAGDEPAWEKTSTKELRSVLRDYLGWWVPCGLFVAAGAVFGMLVEGPDAPAVPGEWSYAAFGPRGSAIEQRAGFALLAVCAIAMSIFAFVRGWQGGRILEQRRRRGTGAQLPAEADAELRWFRSAYRVNVAVGALIAASGVAVIGLSPDLDNPRTYAIGGAAVVFGGLLLAVQGRRRLGVVARRRKALAERLAGTPPTGS